MQASANASTAHSFSLSPLALANPRFAIIQIMYMPEKETAFKACKAYGSEVVDIILQGKQIKDKRKWPWLLPLSSRAI